MLNIFVILNLIENFKCNRKQFYENDKFLKLLLKKRKKQYDMKQKLYDRKFIFKFILNEID